MAKRCVERGAAANGPPEELATLVLKLVYQNPRYGFRSGAAMVSRDGDGKACLEVEAVEGLIEQCVEKLLHDHGPVMELLRMQVALPEPRRSLASSPVVEVRCSDCR